MRPLLMACLIAAATSALAERPAKPAGQPELAFWSAPSMHRLLRYGELLRAGPAYDRMLAKLQAGDPAHVASLPAFTKARQRMREGVIPRFGDEVQRGPAVPVAKMPYAHLLQPKPVRPSLFKAHSDVLLAGEGDEDAFAAVAGARIALVSSKPPVGWAGHHDGPQATGVTGMGDIGLAELSFTPGVVLYSVGEGGLVSAQRLVRRHDYGAADDSICNSRYAGERNLGAVNSDTATLQRVPGYAHVAPDAQPLVTFALGRNAAAPRKARIASRAATVKQVPDVQPPDADAAREAMQRHPAKVVLREIDLDGDGVADILLWETPSWGTVSQDFIINSQWYVNVGGQWYAAGAWEAVDCT